MLNKLQKTKNDIITEIYNDEKYNKMLNTICPSKLYQEDLKHELFIILLNMKDEFIIKLYNENNLIKWCNKILMNQYRSNLSPFYIKYKKSDYNLNMHIDYLKLEENIIEESIYINEDQQIDDQLNIDKLLIIDYVKKSKVLTWAEYELFVFYYKLGESFITKLINKRSYREIAKEFNLTNRVVQKALDNIRYKIIKLLKTDEKYSHLIDKEYEININKRIK